MEAYTGLTENSFKSCIMLTTFFVVFSKTREHTNMWDYKFGQFLVTGCCSSFAWLVCWPFELLKNLS